MKKELIFALTSFVLANPMLAKNAPKSQQSVLESYETFSTPKEKQVNPRNSYNGGDRAMRSLSKPIWGPVFGIKAKTKALKCKKNCTPELASAKLVDLDLLADQILEHVSAAQAIDIMNVQEGQMQVKIHAYTLQELEAWKNHEEFAVGLKCILTCRKGSLKDFLPSFLQDFPKKELQTPKGELMLKIFGLYLSQVELSQGKKSEVINYRAYNFEEKIHRSSLLRKLLKSKSESYKDLDAFTKLKELFQAKRYVG